LTHELDKEDYEERAALYALGALSQHEARSFERHLAEGCASCEEAMLQFEDVVGTIALEPPAATPSLYLRDMLLARIEREGQSQEASLDRSQSRDSSRLEGSIPKPATIAPKDSRSSSPSGRVIIPWAVAAALALALFGSLFAILRAGRESGDLRDQLAAVESRNRRIETEVKELAEINGVLASAEHREIALAGQAPAGSASAKVYWDVKSNKWVVTANLPPAPKGKVYQLWFVTAQEKISAGLIVPDESGHGFTVTNVPSNIGAIAAAAITLEPEGGSEQPTMPIYALGMAG
jgi:anti-sigma-K factor RskA